MIAIKFTKLGANSHFGAFSPGDLARLPNPVAIHLVEDVKCAVYLNAAVHSMPLPLDNPKDVIALPLTTTINKPRRARKTSLKEPS